MNHEEALKEIKKRCTQAHKECCYKCAIKTIERLATEALSN